MTPFLRPLLLLALASLLALPATAQIIENPDPAAVDWPPTSIEDIGPLPLMFWGDATTGTAGPQELADTTYTFPTTLGRHSIVWNDESIDDQVAQYGDGLYGVEIAIKANGYWPGQDGFNFGVVSVPLARATNHALGDYAEEWAFRSGDGSKRHDGGTENFGDRSLLGRFDVVRLLYDSASDELYVYGRKNGEANFSPEGDGDGLLYENVTAPEGAELYFAASAFCWQPCMLTITKVAYPAGQVDFASHGSSHPRGFSYDAAEERLELAWFPWMVHNDDHQIGYQAQIATDPEFEHVVTSQEAWRIGSLAAGDVENGTTYYARVRAQRLPNAPSAWSETLSVTTPSPFAGGTGTEADPYQISTADELNNVRDYLDQHFVLTSDIDLGVAPYDEGAGWEPIGTSGTSFTGTFDGDGFVITGLTIDRSGTNYVGLFGSVVGTISNVGLVDVSVNGNSFVGGLAGLIQATTISNSYSTGSVSGFSRVGGLVGFGTSPVANSYSTASVSGSSSAVGGLVGWQQSGSVSNSYSTGSVNGSSLVGGLVGLHQSTVANSYSTGSVSGSSRVGGLVGYSIGGTASNSFWNTETSGQTTSAGGTGLTTAQMTTRSTYADAGWDFGSGLGSGAWDHDPGTHDGYPFLAWQDLVEVAGFRALPDLTVMTGTQQQVRVDATTSGVTALSVSSSDASVLGTNDVLLRGEGERHALAFTVPAGQGGTTTLTVQGTYEGQTVERSFTVNAVEPAVVTTAADDLVAGDGQCTLREALANVETGSDTTGGDCLVSAESYIRLDAALAGSTLHLGSGQLAVAFPVVLDGSSAPGAAIDADGQSRVFYVGSGGDVTVRGLTLTGGTAFGSGFDDTGGAALVEGGTALFDAVTVTGNRAGYGHAFYVTGGDGTLRVLNSTIAGNGVGEGDSALRIYNGGTMAFIHTTIYGNGGSGITQSGSGSYSFFNSILGGSDGNDCGVPDAAFSHTLVEDGTCITPGTNDNLSGDPLLGALAGNGGPTPTMEPQAGSPVLGAATLVACQPADQRFFARTEACDVGAVQTAGAPLPVELAGFEATPDGGAVRLSWSTASETGNAGFEVQHRQRSGAWQTLAFVEGAGTTSEARSYEHRARGLAPGTHVFRLRQIDHDGTATLSAEVEAAVGMAEALALEPVAPNPVVGRATVQFAAREAGAVTLEAFDVLGRRVATLFHGEVPAGETRQVAWDAAGLGAGVYVLRLSGAAGQRTQTVTLVR